MSQIPYSGGFQDWHGNSNFLSLFLASISNLPAWLPHTETMLEPATCRCTPRCLNPKVRLSNWIQSQGWISGLQPPLAFNASSPLQKFKLTWKPLLLHHLSGCTICHAVGCRWHIQRQIYNHILLMVSRGSSEPGEGTNGWVITKPLSGSSTNKHLVLVRPVFRKLNLKWRTCPRIERDDRKPDKVLAPYSGHLQIKRNNFLTVYGYVLRCSIVIVWLFSVLWCYTDEILIAWVIGSPRWLFLSLCPP